MITLLERDLDPKPDSKEFLYPGDGVNLSAVCSNNQCPASTTNKGLVVVRVGRVESRTYRELVTNQSCSCCNYPLEAGCFHGVVFNSCQGEVEKSGNVQRFNAHKIPQFCKIDLSDDMAIVRMRQTITDIDTAPESAPETVRPEHVKPSSFPMKQMAEQAIGEHHSPHTPGLNLWSKCPNSACAFNKRTILIGVGSADSLRYKEIILGQTCPSCHQPIPLTSFQGVVFFQCKAKVVSNGEQTEYVVGRIPELCEISLEGAEVEITVLERRLVTTGIESPKSQILKPSKETSAILINLISYSLKRALV